MKYSAIVLLVAAASAMTVSQDSTKPPPPTAADTPSSGYYGADEDDVMNNIFNHYAVPITNAAGQATGAKVLYKDGCQKAAAEILLVSKQVSEAKMESYMAEFFPRTWAKFDINNSGEIDITESHTFMRSLLGRLNQFVLAPGSLTDLKVWVFSWEYNPKYDILLRNIIVFKKKFKRLLENIVAITTMFLHSFHHFFR